MTKKRSKQPVSNYQRQRAEAARQAAKIPTLDRIANWLGRRSRSQRAVICGLIALVFTLATGAALYGSLFNVDPSRIKFGPINVNNLPFFIFLGLALAGYAFYWAGWRVMIGFDFDEHPLQPGRPAAWWVIFGLMILVFCVIGGLTLAIQAVQQ